MISGDEEGGLVDRLGDWGFAPPLASAQYLSSQPLQKTRQAGVTAARELQSLGMNTDLAPVVDVRSIPNPLETTRLFSANAATVTRYAGAFLDGVQSQGVIACLKHWPGIGGLPFGEDPHDVLPVEDRTTAQLNAVDFATFRGLLSHQPAMIMVTHVIMRAYDANTPATLSPTLVNGILRGKLGYDGVVMTDSLYMGAIKQYLNDQQLYSELPRAAVLAVIAGDDLLEGAFDQTSMSNMLTALKAAMKDGRISKARIDQSVRRILTLKARYGLLPLIGLPQT
jgi:beta-N-acetylhexosaminidase